tara:strand:- start:24 stop:509 length:486 start_codon:yes stop_codon:yes gene_type:complete
MMTSIGAREAMERLYSASGVNDYFIANTFDFNVRNIKNDSTIPTSWDIHISKQTDTGMVHAFDYWDKCDYEMQLPANVTVFQDLPLVDYAFKVILTLNNSRLVALYEPVTNTFTEESNIGADLSLTDFAKYRIYYSGPHITIRTTSTILGGGSLKITFNRA